jgi:hypothetical protein
VFTPFLKCIQYPLKKLEARRLDAAFRRAISNCVGYRTSLARLLAVPGLNVQFSGDERKIIVRPP